MNPTLIFILVFLLYDFTCSFKRVKLILCPHFHFSTCCPSYFQSFQTEPWGLILARNQWHSSHLPSPKCPMPIMPLFLRKFLSTQNHFLAVKWVCDESYTKVVPFEFEHSKCSHVLVKEPKPRQVIVIEDTRLLCICFSLMEWGQLQTRFKGHIGKFETKSGEFHKIYSLGLRRVQLVVWNLALNQGVRKWLFPSTAIIFITLQWIIDWDFDILS